MLHALKHRILCIICMYHVSCTYMYMYHVLYLVLKCTQADYQTPFVLSVPTFPVTLAQLMRPGICQNGSFAPRPHHDL